MLGKTYIIGRLGSKPELRNAGNVPVCNFSVATNYKYKDKEETTWYRVTAWAKLAELCSKYLDKGSKVYVDGRIRTGSYEKDGQTMNTWELVANEVKFLSERGEVSSDSNQERSIKDDDELPF